VHKGKPKLAVPFSLWERVWVRIIVVSQPPVHGVSWTKHRTNCRDFQEGRIDVRVLVYINMPSAISKINSSQDKILGIPRSYFGAILGMVIFLIIAIVNSKWSNKAIPTSKHWIAYSGNNNIWFSHTPLQFSSFDQCDNLFYYLFSFHVLSIPAGFLGSRLYSVNR